MINDAGWTPAPATSKDFDKTLRRIEALARGATSEPESEETEKSEQ